MVLLYSFVCGIDYCVYIMRTDRGAPKASQPVWQQAHQPAYTKSSITLWIAVLGEGNLES